MSSGQNIQGRLHEPTRTIKRWSKSDTLSTRLGKLPPDPNLRKLLNFAEEAHTPVMPVAPLDKLESQDITRADVDPVSESLAPLVKAGSARHEAPSTVASPATHSVMLCGPEEASAKIVGSKPLDSILSHSHGIPPCNILSLNTLICQY
ncbi:hypothetical protein SO802_002158 [Lithocarpus litseifolius]|uniref:Uncharacterized protein n=1 Tax=Lithocarpus litseifolius TaxID=425828 RepID=A0AAW2DYA1_9ROSI